MKSPSVLVSLLLILLVVSNAADDQQCLGLKPQPAVASFLGADLDYSVSDRICCNNHRYAEYSGYLVALVVALFSRLYPNAGIVFYDSVCGIPLFIAPRGRTFEEYKEESLNHGWPSFRPEELISKNVILHRDGRMESKCLTHLGHNLPSNGIDRYCIDLVCVAGAPVTADSDNSNLYDVVLGLNDVITADEFTNGSGHYTSTAEQFSGKYNKLGRKIAIIAFGTIIAVILSCLVCWFRKNKKKRE